VKLIKEIVLPFAKVQLYEPPLARIEFMGRKPIGREECIEVNGHIARFANFKEIPVLIMATEEVHFEAEAREESSSEAGMKHTMADGFVARNLAQKLMVNFYLKFNRPRKPSKAFTSEEEAVKWLYSIAESRL